MKKEQILVKRLENIINELENGKRQQKDRVEESAFQMIYFGLYEMARQDISYDEAVKLSKKK